MKINNEKISFCPIPWSEVFIGNKGKYMVCCMNYTSLGNIHEENINEVWNNEKTKEIRKYIKNNQYEEAGCDKNCPMIHQFKNGRGSDLFNEQWLKVKNNAFSKNLELLKKSINNDNGIALNNPIVFSLQPTEQCNMKCIMCNQNHTSQVKVEKNLLKELFVFPESIHTIRFQGGEIFVNNEYKELILELKENSLPFQSIQVITNGSLLSHKDLSKMADRKKYIKFIISVDGTTGDVYSKIRVNPHFEKVMSNIKYLANIQNKFEVNDLIQWAFVVMKSNFYQLKEALLIANELNIQVNFQAIIGSFKTENIFLYKDLINQKDAMNYLDDILNISFLRQENIEQIKVLKEKLSNGE